MARNTLAGTKTGKSDTAKYYQEHPEARAKKQAYDKKYNAKPSEVAYGRNIEGLNGLQFIYASQITITCEVFLQVGNLNIGQQMEFSQLIDRCRIEIERMLEVKSQIFEKIRVVELLSFIK